MSWSRKFHKPVYLRAGKKIETLAQARDFMLALGDAGLRNEWQFAAGKLLECAKGGTCYAARDAFVNALFCYRVSLWDLSRE